jgi:hypothetical protein
MLPHQRNHADRHFVGYSESPAGSLDADPIDKNRPVQVRSESERNAGSTSPQLFATT